MPSYRVGIGEKQGVIMKVKHGINTISESLKLITDVIDEYAEDLEKLNCRYCKYYREESRYCVFHNRTAETYNYCSWREE